VRGPVAFGVGQARRGVEAAPPEDIIAEEVGLTLGRGAVFVPGGGRVDVLVAAARELNQVEAGGLDGNRGESGHQRIRVFADPVDRAGEAEKLGRHPAYLHLVAVAFRLLEAAVAAVE